jgi:hypothetical protein
MATKNALNVSRGPSAAGWDEAGWDAGESAQAKAVAIKITAPKKAAAARLESWKNLRRSGEFLIFGQYTDSGKPLQSQP